MALALLGAFSCGTTEVVARRGAAARPTTDASGIPVASSPAGLMRPGAERAIQRALAARGLLPAGAASGRLDQPTQDALRIFQEGAGLAATGLPGYATVEALGLALEEIFHHRRAGRGVGGEER